MTKARGFGLKSVLTQMKLMTLTINLKRIAKLFSKITTINIMFLIVLERYLRNNPINKSFNKIYRKSC